MDRKRPSVPAAAKAHGGVPVPGKLLAFPQQNARFTLIELLVVIAIIAILAAILLPALSSARAHAQEIDCIARKRELMRCIHFYMDDNEDFIPGPKLYNANTGVIYPVLLKAGYLFDESVLGKLSHCTTTEHTSDCSPHNNSNPGPSAGVNSNFCLYARDGAYRRPYRIGRVSDPTGVAYLADTRGWADNGCEDGKVGFSYQEQAAHFGFFHGSAQIVYAGDRKISRVEGHGRATVAYVDGHTGSVARDEVLQYQADDLFFNPTGEPAEE